MLPTENITPTLPAHRAAGKTTPHGHAQNATRLYAQRQALTRSCTHRSVGNLQANERVPVGIGSRGKDSSTGQTLHLTQSA